MNFVLDTNAVSETRKPRPNQGLMNWLSAQDHGHLFVTTLTLAEVWHGFYRLDPAHSDYNSIKHFATELPRQYRVLDLDARAAAMWGELTARSPQLLPLRDSFIAAIVLSRGHRVVTRDAAVFARMGCKTVSPWK